MQNKNPGAEAMDDARAAEEVRLAHLLDVIRRLRAPGGCPWDRAQTHSSLRRYVLEEAAELADALEDGDPAHMIEELGDVLLQVVLHARIGWEAQRFGLQDIVDGLEAKMVRRHPHVFGDAEAANEDEVQGLWEEVRRTEGKGARKRLPRHAAGLARAAAAGAHAATVGFDWPTASAVLDKVREETREVADALEADDKEGLREEIGDLLFSVAQLARHAQIDPDDAAREATAKFERRFHALEAEAGRRGQPLASLSSEALEELWDDVKRAAKGRPA